MDEKQFEVNLQKLVRLQWRNAHVFKVAMGQWRKGVPDLHVTIPDVCSAWVELKYVKVNNFKRFPLDLMPLQRRFLAKEQLAGGMAGWMVLASLVDQRLTMLIAGNNPYLTHAGIEEEHNYHCIGRSYKRDPEQFSKLFSSYRSKHENISI